MYSLYPSANNAQPVRAIVEEDRALIFGKINKKNQVHKIDTGIFIAHFYLSCIEEGLLPSVSIEPLESKNYNVPMDYEYVRLIRF